MKTPSMPFAVRGPLFLLALFAAGSLLGSALSWNLPAPVLGFGFVLLGLRAGAMAAALEEPPAPPARPIALDARAHRPALRAANG